MHITVEQGKSGGAQWGARGPEFKSRRPDFSRGIHSFSDRQMDLKERDKMSLFGRCVIRWVVLTGVFLSGCAPAPVVVPTSEEMEAVKPYKKVVAVVDFSDDGSPIQGVNTIAASKLEGVLVGHFNLVERQRIEQVKAERNFGPPNEVERLRELGKLLGADYVIFGNVSASLGRPEWRQTAYRDKKGRFYGRIWNELCGFAEVTVKMTDVSQGITRYSGKKSAQACDSQDDLSFDDENAFYIASTVKTAASAVGQITGWFSRLEDRYSLLVARALDDAIGNFKTEFRTQFPQTGQVLQILSAKEVLVNLGSAYGIKAGDALTVWEEKGNVMDPKTGLTVVQKQRKALLKVSQVTSGLTCVARGSAKQISVLRVGDPVSTQ